MTTRISKEWKIPLEEVASWGWRRRELYANSLAELNRHDQNKAQEDADDYQEGQDNVPSGGSQGMSNGDVHPALSEYDNVAKNH